MPRTPGQLADALAAAYAARDEASFAACFDPAPDARSLAALLWANWTTLAATCAPTGSGGLRLRWRAPGEGTQAVEEVTVRSSAAGATWLAAQGAEPAWLRERVAVSSTPGAALVAAATLPPGDTAAWLAAAGAASAVVAAAGLGAAAFGWDGTLVVTLPGTPEGFAAQAGLEPGQAIATQAATTMAEASSAPRIHVNPAASAALDAPARRALLVHEGVHAATRSAVSTAPLWLVEGVAESVTATADPATARRNAELVAAASDVGGLPTRAQLDGPEAPAAYALAARAVDAAAARWGRTAVMGWLADWAAPGRPTDAELTGAFLAALRG